MSISIKSVNVEQVKDRVKEIFGDIDASDIAVVKLDDNAKKAETEIAITNIQELRKKIQSNFVNGITESDVSVVKVNNVDSKNSTSESNFSISTGTMTDLKQKLEEAGFSLQDMDVAVVTAEDLNSQSKNKNGNNKKLKN